MVWNFRFKPFFVTRFWNFLMQNFSKMRTKIRKDFGRSSIVQQRFWSTEKALRKPFPRAFSQPIFTALKTPSFSIFYCMQPKCCKIAPICCTFLNSIFNGSKSICCKMLHFLSLFSLILSAPFSAQINYPKSTSSALPAPTAKPFATKTMHVIKPASFTKRVLCVLWIFLSNNLLRPAQTLWLLT